MDETMKEHEENAAWSLQELGRLRKELSALRAEQERTVSMLAQTARERDEARHLALEADRHRAEWEEECNAAASARDRMELAREEANERWRTASQDADAFRDRVERAEADNAALRASLQKFRDSIFFGERWGAWFCSTNPPPASNPNAVDEHALREALTVLDRNHPGAALLERLRALEEALRGVVERAQDREALIRVGEVCIIMGSPRCEWDDGIREEVRQRGDSGTARDVALGAAIHVLGSAANALKERKPSSSPPPSSALDTARDALGEISTMAEDKALRDLDPTDANSLGKVRRVLDAIHAHARATYDALKR